jgi:putative flippase GtrA
MYLVQRFGSMWRWAIVGTITFLIDYLILIGVYSVITSLLIANFLAGLISITFNYLSHYLWSFKSQAYHSKSGSKYFINLLVFWSFGTLLLQGLVTVGIDPKIAKLIPIPILAPFSFLTLKFIVFKKTKLSNL